MFKYYLHEFCASNSFKIFATATALQVFLQYHSLLVKQYRSLMSITFTTKITIFSMTSCNHIQFKALQQMMLGEKQKDTNDKDK